MGAARGSLEFRVLGPLEVLAAGEPVQIGGARQRIVLALLLVHAGELVRRDSLIDELFGGSADDRAANATHALVSRLRRALHQFPGREMLLTRPGGYVLEAGPEQLDAQRFEQLLSDGRDLLVAGDPAGSAEQLRAALALWRGPAFADLALVEVLQPEIRRLEELRRSAREARIEADMQLGRHAELIGELESLLAEQPTREQLAGQLMLALYRGGRQAEALEVYQRTRAHLIDELGLEPGRPLRLLQAQVLEQSPALAAPAPEPPQARASVTAHEPPPAAVPAPQTPSRRVVSVLCVRVSPPDGLDPEVLDELMTRCFAQARAAVVRHGGLLERLAGRELVACFGLERVREDDALRSLRAAVELRDALGEQLGVSPAAALSTGLIVTGDGEHGVTGYPLIQSSTLLESSQPGDILLTAETHRLVRGAVEVTPVTAETFRVERFDPGAPPFARRLDLPIVGRKRELGLLRDVFTRTVAESECHLFTVLGEAGVGKSRLIAELLATIRKRVTILRGRCLPYGDGITLWPLLEALTEVPGTAAERVRELLGSGSGTPIEMFVGVRLLLESLALNRPLILHIDDLQWAPQMLLDLLEHIIDLARAPILVLCTARLELVQGRPGWGGGKLNVISVLLRPLSPRECGKLIGQLAGELGSETRDRVIRASEGNPLYLEEMVALISERGLLALPSTIEALLAERLEGLAREERELLAHAAIEGEVFHRGAAIALAPDSATSAPDATLDSLVRKQLIRSHAATLQGQEAFRFHHLLIRDAAYESLPKSVRAGLHERFADWLESLAPEPVQLNVTAGWHLEQAIRYQRELGRQAETAQCRRASKHLHAAGRRAATRGDVAAALNLFERASELTPKGDSLRAAIGVELAGQLLWAGELTRAGELLSTWEHEPEVAALAAVTRFEWLVRVRPDETLNAIESSLPSLIDALERAGDEQGMARAHMAAHQALNIRCRWQESGDQAQLAVEHARRAGDSDLRWRALSMYLGALVRGPQHASVLAQELDRIEREEEDPDLFALQAVRININRTQLAGLEGRFADARRFSRQAMDAARALGLPEVMGACQQSHAFIELDAGEPEAALEVLLSCDADLAARNDSGNRSSIQAMLAYTYALLGEPAPALECLRWLDELNSPELFNYVFAERARARLALDDGEAVAAERWARSAVGHAAPTDWVVLQADARLDLARVISALGRHDQAADEARAALDLFRAKGSVPGERRARALLGAVAPV